MKPNEWARTWWKLPMEERIERVFSDYAQAPEAEVEETLRRAVAFLAVTLSTPEEARALEWGLRKRHGQAVTSPTSPRLSGLRQDRRTLQERLDGLLGQRDTAQSEARLVELQRAHNDLGDQVSAATDRIDNLRRELDYWERH